MKLTIKSQKVADKGGKKDGVEGTLKWNVLDIQEKRKRTWSLWDEGKRPMTRRGTCPLSFEQVVQQRKRKNSLELFNDKKSTLPKDLSNRGSLKYSKAEAMKAMKAFQKAQEKPLSSKTKESPKEEQSPPSSKPVSPKIDQNTLSPKEEQKQTIKITRESESFNALGDDGLGDQK